MLFLPRARGKEFMRLRGAPSQKVLLGFSAMDCGGSARLKKSKEAVKPAEALGGAGCNRGD